MTMIISRETWGAKHNDGFYNRKVGRLDKWLHHSVTVQLAIDAALASEYREMRKLDDIGQSRFKSGISYTFVIFPSGRIYEGHSIGRVGAHTAGRNSISAGICLAGNYETHEVTAEQVASLAWLLNEGIDRGWWTEPKLDGGHRDTKSTACPGKNAYAKIPAINKLSASGDVVPVAKPNPEKVVEQKSSKGKGIQQLASEVRAGKHGNGHANRQRSLGVDDATYAKIRAEVNKREGVKAPAASKPSGKSVAAMAAEVIAGKHGTGHANRQRSLGISAAKYAEVRAEVNRRAGGGRPARPKGKSISQMAAEVIQGKHGNGHATRQRSLGVSAATYAKVRAEVNKRI
ncbi:N-acetylmuramoyl-L-alanine amidase [Glutamicibacter nicotianae]|uniref:N-acetylmuramoyl-L-alanine amidase n=1 Tax=Glutamicibacter nicotianae TaxID=37929 RepID=UPI0025566300|nr:N-acetylmuramoyl-L-alanine amidase [Glutamicibacter nicotianae]WIV42601.1 N-acetylmuramoyl-L-alanine amidase [Glutamicibacter nicotianae]